MEAGDVIVRDFFQTSYFHAVCQVMFDQNLIFRRELHQDDVDDVDYDQGESFFLIDAVSVQKVGHD